MNHHIARHCGLSFCLTALPAASFLHGQRHKVAVVQPQGEHDHTATVLGLSRREFEFSAALRAGDVFNLVLRAPSNPLFQTNSSDSTTFPNKYAIMEEQTWEPNPPHKKKLSVVGKAFPLRLKDGVHAHSERLDGRLAPVKKRYHLLSLFRMSEINLNIISDSSRCFYRRTHWEPRRAPQNRIVTHSVVQAAIYITDTGG